MSETKIENTNDDGGNLEPQFVPSADDGEVDDDCIGMPEFIFHPAGNGDKKEALSYMIQLFRLPGWVDNE